MPTKTAKCTKTATADDADQTFAARVLKLDEKVTKMLDEIRELAPLAGQTKTTTTDDSFLSAPAIQERTMRLARETLDLGRRLSAIAGEVSDIEEWICQLAEYTSDVSETFYRGYGSADVVDALAAVADEISEGIGGVRVPRQTMAEVAAHLDAVQAVR